MRIIDAIPSLARLVGGDCTCSIKLNVLIRYSAFGLGTVQDCPTVPVSSHAGLSAQLGGAA